MFKINVGIGTNTPQSSLHIDNPSGSDVTITTDWDLKCNTMMVSRLGWEFISNLFEKVMAK